jgi:hypothetical protein
MSTSLSGYGKLTGHPVIPSIDGLTGDHSSQKLPLGSVIKDTVGNSYKYIKANEALTRGDAVTAIARAAWDSGILVNGEKTSGTTLTIDTVTTAMSKNEYAGYYVSQATAANKGKAYEIESHEAMAASGGGDLILAEEIDETFADNAALYIHHPFLMEQTDAATDLIMGVVAGDISSGQFGWIQVGGYCPWVKAGDGTTAAAIVANEPLVPNGDNAGAVMGIAGSAEADILEAAASPLRALRAVGANTAGFVEAFIHGLV